MDQWKKNLWFLAAAGLISNIAFTMSTPFLPQFLQELGLSSSLSLWSGILISANFLTYAVMAPVWGSLADSYGKRVMFVRSGFGIAVTYVLQGLARNHWQLLIYKAANGLLSGFIPTIIMMVATNTPVTEMGYALGIINTFIALGAILGPFVGGALLGFMNMRMLMFIAAFLLFVASALAVFGTKETIFKRKEQTTIRHDLTVILGNKSLRIYFLCMVMLSMSTYMIQPTLPLFIADIVQENTEFITGIIFSIVGVSLAVGSPLISRIKGLGYTAILFYGLILCGVFNVVQGFTYSVILLGLERLLFGFANAAVSISGNVLITTSASEEMRGRVFGTLNGLTAVGQVLAPLMGGLLGEHLGNASTFYAGALFLFTAALAVWKLNADSLRPKTAQPLK